jgi:hypothetical protein
MAKKLSQFDVAKDEWYYQKKLYVNTRSTDSLYEELKEFRTGLAKSNPDDSGFTRLLEDLYEEDDYALLKKARKTQERTEASPVSSLPSTEAAGFLDLKLSLLREQIELAKANLRERKAIYEKSRLDVYYEIRRVKTELQDLYGWRKGEKATTDATKMELLRQMAALYREKRMNGLNHWKDLTIELRDLRALVAEYKSLKALVAVADIEGDGNGVAG